jgi:hypothetical protein
VTNKAEKVSLPNSVGSLHKKEGNVKRKIYFCFAFLSSYATFAGLKAKYESNQDKYGKP